MSWTPPAVGARATWTRTFTAADVEAFAGISGDRNPLHFDAAYAEGTRLGRLVVQGGLREGDTVLIGPDPDAVVFDFRPMVDAGETVLSNRRGEDERFNEERPSAARRRAIDAAYADRLEGEARADVARRFDDGGDEATEDDA